MSAYISGVMVRQCQCHLLSARLSQQSLAEFSASRPITQCFSLCSMSALEIIDQVPEFSRLVALELQSILYPYQDEISTNEAYKRYGRTWVEKYTGLGELHPKTHGIKRIYSISELERVKAKENVVARLVVRK